MRIVSFNPAARYLLRVFDQDLGTSIRAVGALLDLSAVVSKLEEALREKMETSLQLQSGERSFEVQIQLFRGVKDAVQGAVVSFVDNTEIVNSLAEARAHQATAERHFSRILLRW